MSDFLKGRNFVIVPRVTTVERNALVATNGMLVYDTTLNAFYKYENGAWSAFGGGGSGTVTSVSALTLGTTGTDLSSTVANSTTTPVITLNVPTASASNRGALSSSDWTTFNSKQDNILKASLSSGDATLTSSTTPTDITGLSFALEANSRYYLSGILAIGSGSSSGGQFGVTIPTGASMRITLFGMQNSAAASKRELITTSGVLVGAFPTALTTTGYLKYDGTIETGANAGNFQVQWACTSAPGYTITCYKLGTALTLLKL